MIELVASDGYRSVTVRKLTKLARVSPRAFYSQFDGVEECFVATYSSLMGAAQARVESTRSHRDSRPEQVRRLLQVLTDEFAPDRAAGRLALIESFGGGPAALARIRAEEARLDAAVRECLDRREGRMSPGAVSWVTAGALRMTRSSTLGGAGKSMTRLVRWALPYLDPDPPDLSGREVQRDLQGGWEVPAPGPSRLAEGARERDLILAASSKLVRAEGYWSLSIGKVRSAAGVSRAGFNRHFRDVEDCYLAAIADHSRACLAPLTARAQRSIAWADGLHRGMLSLCQRLAADPTMTRVAFGDVLAPGVNGLACREALITEFASAWRGSMPMALRPDPISAEITAAALWSAIDRCAWEDADRLPGEAATFSYLLLSPVIGRSDAEEVVLR